MTKPRAAGLVLIALGLLMLLVPVALIVWMHGMYTTGVSVDSATGSLLPLWLAIGAGLLIGGGWLIHHAKTSHP